MIQLLAGDCRDVLATLPAESVQCVVTSPPYWNLRDYGTALWDGGDAACDHRGAPQRTRATLNANWGEGYADVKNAEAFHPFRDTCGKCGARRIDRQIGLENSPEAYLATMVAVFREVRRVLRRDGTLFLNIGDSYASGEVGRHDGGRTYQDTYERKSFGPRKQKALGGLKPKDLLLMPARLALALQADGWWVRSDIIWHKPNPMPESCTDRPTSAHEHVFLLAKSPRYFYDPIAIAERITDTGVGHKPNPRNQRRAFRDNLRLHQSAGYDPTVHTDDTRRLLAVGIRIATATFDFAKTQHQLGALPFDAQIWEDGTDEMARPLIRGAPVVGWAAAQATRFTNSDIPAEQFLYELHRLWVALSDGDKLKEAWRFAFGDRGLVVANGDGTICVNDASDVGEIELVHSEYDTTSRADPPTRNARNVWEIATAPYPKSHFATFPAALAERCIRAGTSERGACSQCGKPWARETQLTPEYAALLASGKAWRDNSGKPDEFTNRQPSDHPANVPQKHTTTGWSAACKCEAGDPVPCKVLDPFAGAGTTLLVADRLQRDAIGIELNPSYTEMAMQRCRDDAPLFTAFPPADDPEEARMVDLFADAAE